MPDAFAAVNLRRMGIAIDLADYDGKSVELLETLRVRYEPTAEVLAELVRITVHGDGEAPIGASWLLRASLEDGASLPASAVEELTAGLDTLGSHWVRLHVCRLVGSLPLDARQAERWARFLEDAARSKRPFLRAWATDGLVRLAERHPTYRPRARSTLESALADPAASVRARARRIVAERE